jgi:hypothetical protein
MATPATLATIMARLGAEENNCLTVPEYVDVLFPHINRLPDPKLPPLKADL